MALSSEHSLLGHLKHVRNRAAQLGARSSKEISFGGKNLGEKSLGQLEDSKEIPFGGTETTLGFLLDVLKQAGLCLLCVIPKNQLIINLSQECECQL